MNASEDHDAEERELVIGFNKPSRAIFSQKRGKTWGKNHTLRFEERPSVLNVRTPRSIPWPNFL